MSKKTTNQQNTWNLSPLFSSDEDPNIAKNRQKVEENVKAFCSKWKSRDDYLADAKVLKEALDDYEHLMRNYGIEGDWGYYFWLRTMLDQVNPELKGQFAKVVDFSNEMNNQLQFFELKLTKVTKKRQKEFLLDKSLASYKHSFHDKQAF